MSKTGIVMDKQCWSMRMLKSLCITLLFFFLLTAPVFAEEMVVKKIILGRFAVENNKIVLSKSDPYWPGINRHNLTIDDKGHIYVLNLLNREVVVFDGTGKISKKIPLPIKPFKKKLIGYGQLEVSDDGKRIFVNIPGAGLGYERDFVPSSGLAVNDKGEVIRHTGFSRVDIRLCNKTYVFLQGSYIYDNEFRRLKERFIRFSDSEGMYDINKRALAKTTRDGKKLWEKQFDGYFLIVGIDKHNYIYIKGRLKKGDPYSLYKLDAKGNIIAQAPIPKPFPFLTQEEKDEWEARPSEEFLSFFKVTCNGDAYLIYQLGELPTLTFKRWLKGEEYFIYKFEVQK